jgi:hypothetical protein
MREALPLLSTYFYSEQVLLGPSDTKTAIDDFGDLDEHKVFSDLLRMRHAIACALRLKPIVEAIQRGYSHSSQLVRSESKGTIRGRLDIALYLNRRGAGQSWPRTFPVIVGEADAGTPENQLVADSLRKLAQRLQRADKVEQSAESMYCRTLAHWTQDVLRSPPWNNITASRGALRLRRETEQRLLKRQTGNESAYGALVDWHRSWSMDPSKISPSDSENLVDLLLAFPFGDFFGDRVFEIWCLQQVIESFRRYGATNCAGPRPLSERGARAICSMQYEGYQFDIWFQKAFPAASARWTYLHSQRILGGRPDITVVGSDGRRLLIDAKRREVRTQTRSEETYKMLGYLENFRELFQNSQFWGALCFLSNTDLFTEATTVEGHRIVLLGAHIDDPAVCAFGGSMDTLVSEWLSRRRSSSWSVERAPPQLM